MSNTISSTLFLGNFLKKELVQIFSSFAAVDHKGHFRKILTWIFKFGWFSWYHSYHSWSFWYYFAGVLGTITFCNIWDIFAWKQGGGGGSQVKGVESKFDKHCFIHTIPGQLSVKKTGSNIFVDHKGHFRKMLT